VTACAQVTPTAAPALHQTEPAAARFLFETSDRPALVYPTRQILIRMSLVAEFTAS
jgi:hypothetical protein